MVGLFIFFIFSGRIQDEYSPFFSSKLPRLTYLCKVKRKKQHNRNIIW